MARADAPALFPLMVQFFADEEWPFSQVEGQSALTMGFQGDRGRWICFAQVREEQQQFAFYSLCPVRVPEFKLLDMAEFIARANYGLIIGNFEMDFNDGEVRYKTSVDVEGAELVPALMRGCVYANVLMMDQYLPGILALVYSDLTPAQALARVER